MKKIYIIHENDEWIEPLQVHLYDLQIPFEDWHMDKLNIDIFNIILFNIINNNTFSFFN